MKGIILSLAIMLLMVLGSFGDGGTSNQQNPTHEHSDGSYTTTLTVTDDDRDSNKVYDEVTVYENTAPNKPSLTGPSSEKIKIETSLCQFLTLKEPLRESTYLRLLKLG